MVYFLWVLYVLNINLDEDIGPGHLIGRLNVYKDKPSLLFLKCVILRFQSL